MVRLVARLGVAAVALTVVVMVMVAARSCHRSIHGPPVETRRCTHAPEPQDDGTTLCRSREWRLCSGRECGPWMGSDGAKVKP